MTIKKDIIEIKSIEKLEKLLKVQKISDCYGNINVISDNFNKIKKNKDSRFFLYIRYGYNNEWTENAYLKKFIQLHGLHI